MFLVFSQNLPAQCENDDYIFYYEFEEHERIYYKVSDEFDYSVQTQYDLLKIRERTSENKRVVTIDNSYRMTENVWVLNTRNKYASGADRLLESVYTYDNVVVKYGQPGSGRGSQAKTFVYQNDEDSKDYFYTRLLAYLNGDFGWPVLDAGFFSFLANKGFIIQNMNGVMVAQSEKEKLVYDASNYLYYNEIVENGIKNTVTLKFYEKRGHILPALKRETKTITLYNGDCVEEVIEYRYPEDKTHICILPEGGLQPRNDEVAEAPQLIYYPNPVFDELTILNPMPEKVINLSVFDVNGALVFNKEYGEDTIEIALQTDNLKSGMYLVRLSSQEEMLSFRFIKY